MTLLNIKTVKALQTTAIRASRLIKEQNSSNTVRSILHENTDVLLYNDKLHRRTETVTIMIVLVQEINNYYNQFDFQSSCTEYLLDLLFLSFLMLRVV